MDSSGVGMATGTAGGAAATNTGMTTVGGGNNMMFFSNSVPDRSSGLQIFALFVLFSFPSLALVVVSLRAAGRWAWRQFGWGTFLNHLPLLSFARDGKGGKKPRGKRTKESLANMHANLLDDTLICVAMFMSAIETAASYKYIKTNYVGIRGRDIPPHDPTEGMVWNYAVQIFYNPILALVKLSVLIFLYRLFAHKRGVKLYIVGLSGVTLVQLVAVAGAIIFQCTPIAFNWTPTLPNGRCVDQRSLYVSTAAFTILTDVLVLGLPAYIFRDLNIPKKTKIALLVVFLMGGL